MALCDSIAKQIGYRIRVRGLVQGVGFRPTVVRLAKECGLVGEVLNDGGGVLIYAWGDEVRLDGFLQRLKNEAPPLSRIEKIESRDIKSDTCACDEFKIVKSKRGGVWTGVVPDAATCPKCLEEIFDRANRRYRYPFTNCTHCGPRLSIVRAIPYDRKNTSMASFQMCDACQKEYDNPADRRFHAQPNACPDCGPKLWLEDREGMRFDISDHTDAIAVAAELIRAGFIVAVKGIGGFHLACDARNSEVVSKLRRRKKRYDKPFALMVRDIATIENFVHVGLVDRDMLLSSLAPIVVMDRRDHGAWLAEDIAPGQRTLGFMLPYTPLHHVLLNDLDIPIVLTSGNASDEPQVVSCGEARKRLLGIADIWLMHDRDIVNRLDDSVVRASAVGLQVIRRARGFAPAPLSLPPGFESADGILAMGGELKNTFCIVKKGQAVLSQHIGDLENSESHTDFRNNLSLFRNLYEFDPNIIAIDKHPDYLSTQWGAVLAQRESLHLEFVQHHQAHVASCMVENGVPIDADDVLGIALDGSGLGEDGLIWGAEFYAANYVTFQRLAHFAPIPLLGGSKAIREPWRATFAHLNSALGWNHVAETFGQLDVVQYLQKKPLSQLQTMMERSLNAPSAVSAGRLFDAVAGALGLCRDGVSYEGQAAIELEGLAASASQERGCYPRNYVGHNPMQLHWRGLWQCILRDLADDVPREKIAARFHNTVISAICETALTITQKQNIQTVVLTGGTFQNRLLLEGVAGRLQERGRLSVLVHKNVPVNDGGLSLGQAAIAWARRVFCARQPGGAL